MNKSKRITRTKRVGTKRVGTKRVSTKKVGTKRFRIGGVRVYKLDGKFTTDPKILHEGKEFFRKMTTNIGEKKICKILMKNPHKNIIKIYGIGKDYIDMELLDTDMSLEDNNKIKNLMLEVKTYLQSLGIMYIDWKLDNIGINEDGQIKLFDFDVSGLIDIETKEWIIEPPKYWSYNKALQNGMVTPIDIDNYAFNIEFQNKKYN